MLMLLAAASHRSSSPGWRSRDNIYIPLDDVSRSTKQSRIPLGASSTTATTVKQSGKSIDVWAAVETLHKCGDIDVPDIPARAFVDGKGLTHMIVGATGFHRMNGASILMNGSATRECAYAWNQSMDANPAHFAGDEFLDSPIAFANGTVVALIHTEYPGGVYNSTGPSPPMCPDGLKSYPQCWTVTIGLAVSHDFGMTWDHALKPPHHLVAAVPYRYNASQLAYGWGDPSNIMQHPSDGFYYAAMWNRNQVGLQAPGICMMRTNNLMDPRSWRGWGGAKKGYSQSFVSPYGGMKPGTEAEHVCVVTNLPAGTCIPIANKTRGCQAAGLAWSTYLEKFVVTLGCGSAFKWATSEDLITWSEPTAFALPHGLAPNVSKMVSAMNYPTFMDPSVAESDRNYGTIGQKPYLFWASIGHSPYTDGRHQWATPFEFKK
jgi:hypothetical protein